MSKLKQWFPIILMLLAFTAACAGGLPTRPIPDDDPKPAPPDQPAVNSLNVPIGTAAGTGTRAAGRHGAAVIFIDDVQHEFGVPL